MLKQAEAGYSREIKPGPQNGDGQPNRVLIINNPFPAIVELIMIYSE